MFANSIALPKATAAHRAHRSCSAPGASTEGVGASRLRGDNGSMGGGEMRAAPQQGALSGRKISFFVWSPGDGLNVVWMGWLTKERRLQVVQVILHAGHVFHLGWSKICRCNLHPRP